MEIHFSPHGLQMSVAPHTFRVHILEYATTLERYDATELADVARIINPAYIETVRLLVWATGATTRADLTRETVARFDNVLKSVSFRFGTAPEHYDVSVADAIARRAARGSKARGHETITRHHNRVTRILAERLPHVGDWLMSDGHLRFTAPETRLISGWSNAVAVIAVERLGQVVEGRAILTRERLLAGATKHLAPELAAAAARAFGLLTERGRVFVATRRPDDRMLLNQGFWVACCI